MPLMLPLKESMLEPAVNHRGFILCPALLKKATLELTLPDRGFW